MKFRSIRHAATVLVGIYSLPQIFAAGFDTIQNWTGAGTNRAAMVVHWHAPEVRNNTSVPNPIAEKALVWGYRWNGEATAERMLDAIAASDARFFAVINVSQFGTSIMGLGYDLNNNRVFGVQNGTNIFAPSVFTNGLISLPTADADKLRSLDPADLFWSGWSGAGWETWNEKGSAGGYMNAPDRGSTLYWIPDDPTQPYSGNHGEWHLADTGLTQFTLKDGSWIGFAVARGGLDFANPEAPGTIAYGLHKQAPALPESAPSEMSPFASAVLASQGPFGNSPYDAPASLLGMPSTGFYDAFGDFGGSTKERRVKIVEAPFNFDRTQTNKLITTLEAGSSVIVRFDQAVTNDPANPYGIDFLVFGNSFYSADGFVDDAANMNTVKIAGGIFGEPVKVSVSPGYTGLGGEVADNPATWPWYRYENGPFGDTAFPTQGYFWDRLQTKWSARPMDFTKPVNPVLAAVLDAGNLSVADAIDLYTGSGGGTGFDLAPSGFGSIRYAKVEGISPDWAGGEIDAFSVVRPATLGESLSLAPANLTNGVTSLLFRDPANLGQNLLRLNFASLNDLAKVEVRPVDPANTSHLRSILNAIDIGVSSATGVTPITFQADAEITLPASYTSEGTDLNALRLDGTNWMAARFAFNSSSNSVVVGGLTNGAALAVVQVTGPILTIIPVAGGLEIRFDPVVGWTHVLDRTSDFAQWTQVTSIVPQTSQTISLRDDNAPAGNAFYRLSVNRP